MNAKELQRELKKHGCKFETHKGGSGHVTVYRNGKRTQLPMHGKHKEIGKGLLHKILKDLDIKL